MKTDIKYTDPPSDINESLDRAVIIPTFKITPEGVAEFAESRKRAKRQISIYLSVETIENFKKVAEKTGGRYQTLISDVLDTYNHQHLQEMQVES